MATVTLMPTKALTIALHCPGCGARTRADAQLVTACAASLTASTAA